MSEGSKDSHITALVPEGSVGLNANQRKVLRWRVLGYTHQEIADHFIGELTFTNAKAKGTEDTIREVTKSTEVIFGCNNEISATLAAIRGGYVILNDPMDPVVTSGQLNLVNTLTDREREIMDEVLTGVGDEIIGSKFNISADTVKNHMSNIGKKLGVTGGKGVSRVRKAVVYSVWKEQQAKLDLERNRPQWFGEENFDATAALNVMLNGGIGIIVANANFGSSQESKPIIVAAASSEDELRKLLEVKGGSGLGNNIERAGNTIFSGLDNSGAMFAVVTINSIRGREPFIGAIHDILWKLLHQTNGQPIDMFRLEVVAKTRLAMLPVQRRSLLSGGEES